MDKTDKDNKNNNSKKSQLSALFDDLEKTLNDSVMKENKNTESKPDISADKAEKNTKSAEKKAIIRESNIKAHIDPENIKTNTANTDMTDMKKSPAGAVGVKERETENKTPPKATNNEFASIFDDIKSSGTKKPAKLKEKIKDVEDISDVEDVKIFQSKKSSAGNTGSTKTANEKLKKEEAPENVTTSKFSENIENIAGSNIQEDDGNDDNYEGEKNQGDIDFQFLDTLAGDDDIDVYEENFEESETSASLKPGKRQRTAKIPLERFDKADRIDRIDRIDRKYNGLFRASAKEFVSREQSPEIFKEYRRIYLGELLRLGCCIILFLMLAYLEIAPVLHFLSLPEILVHYSAVYILVNMQILLLAAWLTKNSLFFGLKAIFRSEINLYSTALLFFILGFVHTFTAYILQFNISQTMLFNSVAALAMLTVSLYNILDINFEIAGFKAASTKRLKYALRLDNNVPEEREVFREVIPQDTAVGRITKTAFASNFFSRTGSYKNHGESARYYIYASIAAALIMAVVFIIMKREVYQVISAAVFLFLGSVPLCSFISAAYPLFRAQKKSQVSGAAFIGADSIMENSEIAILSLADKDVFPPSTVKFSPGVRVYGNNRLENVLHYLCALCVELDLPPVEEFKSAVDWDAKKAAEADITINDITDAGICYETNGITLFAGKPEYIENLGLIPPADPDLDEQFLKSGGIIMLLASESEVVAKVYLKYELTANFHDILKNIRKMNSCVCIKTFDPNIDEMLLRRLSNIRKFPIKVLKLKDPAEVYKIEDRIETGVVSKDSLKSIINALLIASRTKTIIKTNALVQGIAFGVSLVLTICITLFGSLSIGNAGILLTLQLFWAGMIIFLSALSP